MSVRKVASSNTPQTTGLGVGVKSSAATRPWVRNKSWSTFTAPTASEQKFIGLHAVWPESNLLALTAAGNYTVDWGDGVVENFSSGAQAAHQYDFADANLANTNAPVTFQDTANTITRSSHGYVNGDIVQFYNIVTTTGLNAATAYYVIDATTDTFKVSLTEGGSVVDLVSDGSATLLPYKQSIVQVYPQVGQTLTSLNLNTRAVGTVAYQSGFLDIAVASADLTDLRIGAAFPDNSTFSQNVGFRLLEQTNIVRSNCRQLMGLFYLCDSLQSIPNFNTSESPAANISVVFTDSTDTVTATSHGFNNGDTIFFTSITSTTGITVQTKYFVVGATANTFQVSSTWAGSVLPLTNDGSGVAVQSTTMRNTFNGCRGLTSIQAFDTSSVTDMTNMFVNCNSLRAAPLFDTAAVTSMSGTFANCRTLTSISVLNTSSVNDMSSMFTGCFALPLVPLFNTAAVTNMTNMFNNCFSLQTIPLFDTTSVTNMTNMFIGCSSLQTIPLLNTAAVTNMTNMFSNCYSLRAIPLLNTTSVTTMQGMFNGCSSLQTIPLLSTAAVITMNLMFSSCVGLQTIPLLNTAAVTNMTSMFAGCNTLESVPLLNTAAVTTTQSMFQNCSRITTVPLFNTTSVTLMNAMFQNCYSLQSLPALNTTAVPSFGGFTNTFNGCSNLSRIQAEDFRFTFSVASCKLSADALNEIYTNLPTVSGMTITVTGNYGAATDNPAIATAKGWTVTG